MTDEQLAQIKARREAAWQMVSALCMPRGSMKSREWIMSIPARPDYDPDLVIGASLHDIPALLAEVGRLQQRAVVLEARAVSAECERDALRGMVEHMEESCAYQIGSAFIKLAGSHEQ